MKPQLFHNNIYYNLYYYKNLIKIIKKNEIKIF